MNYKKAKTILRKLNSLLESFENLGEPLSDIECEMLLRYTEEFKKLVPQDHEEAEALAVVKEMVIEKPKAKKKKEKKAKEKAPPKPKAVEIVEEVEEVIEENEEFDVPPVEEVEVVEEVQEIVEELVEEEVKVVPPPKPKSTKKKLVATEEDKTEDIDLWAKKEFKELSEKLSFSPIKNIFKAISINERIFTQNELFGGDHIAFRATLEQLETKANFDEAVAFLKNGVAKEHKWDSPKRIKKASQFMKIVQRRYL